MAGSNVQPGPSDAEQQGVDRSFPESVITDDGVGHRRAGVAVMVAGGLLALLGLTTLTLAYETWSGYVGQAVVAMVLGTGLMGVGWVVLRTGDRLGPRLHVYPSVRRAPADEWAASYSYDRVRVDTFPVAALPRGRR
jgi:hypothetical protein